MDPPQHLGKVHFGSQAIFLQWADTRGRGEGENQEVEERGGWYSVEGGCKQSKRPPKKNRRRSRVRSVPTNEELTPLQPDPEGEVSQDDRNIIRCKRLLEEGQFIRAAQALASHGIDQDSTEAREAMQRKHPQAPPAPSLRSPTTHPPSG